MSRNIIKATGLIMIINVVVRILGFLRDLFIANAFGASHATDAYLIAYTIPYFLQNILGTALVTAVVPMLTKYLVDDNKEEAWYLGSSMYNLTFIGLTAATGIGIIFADFLVSILAPGFTPAQAQLTTELTRIMLPAAIFMGLGMVTTGILNASYRFTVAAFAPGFSSIVIIGSVVLFAGAYGVWGLTVGTFLSFIGLFLIQVPSLIKTGYHYKLVLGLKHPVIKRTLKGIIPIIIGVAVFQLYFAINQIFASNLAEGTISQLSYANKVMQLPIGIFVSSIAATIYPSLSELALQKDKSHFEEILRKGLGLVCLMSIPAAIGLAVLREPIIQILFERGAFTHASTIATANSLLYFSIVLLPMALNMVLTRAFYSLNDVKGPLKIGMLTVVLDVILCFALYKLIPLGGGGLVLSNAIAALLGAWLLYTNLHKQHLPHLKDEGNLKASCLKMLIASVSMGLIVWLVKFALKTVIPFGGFKGAVIIVGVGIIVGCLVYAVMVYLLKVDEVKYILSVINRKLKAPKLNTGEKNG